MTRPQTRQEAPSQLTSEPLDPRVPPDGQTPGTPPLPKVATPAQPPLRLEWIEAGSLTENPHNWRRHSPEQLQSIRDLLNDPDVG